MKMEEFIKAVEGRLQHLKSYSTRKSQELYFELLLEYYQAINKAKQEGKPLALVGVFSPKEIFYAMDIVPLDASFHLTYVGFIGGCEVFKDYLEAAAGYGLPIETCSIHRILIGMVIKEAISPPDFIVGTSHACDGEIKAFETLTDLCQCPDYFLDHPYRADAEGVEYYKREMEGLIQFLEEKTSQKFDFNKLKEVVELSKQATDLYRQINEMRKAVPAPMGSGEFFGILLLYNILVGTPGLVKYFEILRNEIKEQLEKGPTLDRENFRVVFLYSFPFYAMEFFEWMEQEYGVVDVMELMSTFGYTEEEMEPSSPLDTLAKKSFYQPLVSPIVGSTDNFVITALRIARDYRADAAFFGTHIGCKEACATVRIVKDTLRRELGIPTYVIDHDPLVPSVTPPDVIKTKFEGFIEMLEDLKLEQEQ